jgi:hypothetical protein
MKVMGLEAIELVMEIEERFDTLISDSDAGKLLTVGDLYDYLLKRIQAHHNGICACASAFYSLRRLLLTEFGIEHKQVRPNSELSELIAMHDRSRFWLMAQETLNQRLPWMRRSTLFQRSPDQFPQNISTVGTLAKWSSKSYSITREFDQNDTQRLWVAVCELVGRVSGVDPIQLTYDTHFNRDLGF